MYDSSSDMTILQEPLSGIESVLRDAVQHLGNLETPMEMLREFSGSAAEASQPDLASFALQLSGLLEIASLSSEDDERSHEFQEIIEFVIQLLTELGTYLLGHRLTCLICHFLGQFIIYLLTCTFSVHT